jgi:aminopeptidase N
MRTDTPQTIRLSDYRPPAYLINHVSLNVRLNREDTRITARLDLMPNPASPDAGGPLVLDGEGLKLHAINIDGVPLTPDRYTLDDERLTVHKPPQRAVCVETETSCDPAANKALSGLYLSNDVYCTQCEAEGFRRIAFFQDRPDVLSRYRVRLEARKAEAPQLLSNGNLVMAGDIVGTDRHFAIWEDPHAKPSYLFAMVAGDLACVEDEFVTASGRRVKLQIYVEHGKQDRCDWAMTSLKASMKWDEERFGREYDLDRFMIVAVSDFNMGAMENKGLNVFNDKYVLATPDTATDQDYAHVEGIIAHEYFHNWTGNRITCRDWFQLCLKEGLTVYRDQEFSSDIRSRPVKRIADVKLLRAQQFAEDAGPLAHPVRPQSYMEINNFYTATVYEKGAEVVRMMATLLGPQAFRKAMDIYFARHDGQAATVENFVACMQDASGRDLSQFFHWYEQAGTPQVVVESRWLAAEGVLELTMTQTLGATHGQSNKPVFHIPLAIGLVGPDGEDMPLDLEGAGILNNPIIELTGSVQTYRFRNLAQRPVPSLNRGFSAPVRLVANLSADNELALIGADSDPFNRWEMAQNRASEIITAAIAAPDDKDLSDRANGYAVALRRVLADDNLEDAFKALMLMLPGEQDLAREMGSNVDPAAIHRSREALRHALGSHLAAALRQVWDALPVGAAYSPDPAAAGRRSLGYAALDLLTAADAPAGALLALDHFRAATNMTDKMGALNVLARIDCPEREEALSAFYAAHRSDPLLVDKWMALNAISPIDGCIERIRGLMDHELFDITKPNRVRALVGSFAAMNPVQFNTPDGAGYDLLADVIEQLDRFNPQVAARLATNFRSWRALESGRREKARLALVRLRDLTGISRDTCEIVTKSLEG